ncbi:MAG: thioredoxin-like (seleno)protein SaoT [Pyramidobacter sp.]|uniref:thioredoxin-like (seleno)protein SaoT n=1 Tax=Pyramidobacter sp. TaxID=1943581 RepID=UPI002A8355C1|nr:thioredoxin-like (seleno)protein SaoT [Pyramidobacter sp.]MDY4031843.1 thioredoxin-like (seleno)protein SaoT [Pyramidobacter sp.]
MTKIEFINTCPCCDGYGDLLRELQKRFPDKIELKIYYVGKDFDYLPKYGPITRGTMIIDGKDRYEDLNRRSIEKVISEAIGEEL